MVARYWTKVFVICVVLSYLAAFAFLLVYLWVDVAFDIYDPAQYGVMYQVMSSPTFWFLQACSLTPPPPFRTARQASSQHLISLKRSSKARVWVLL